MNTKLEWWAAYSAARNGLRIEVDFDEGYGWDWSIFDSASGELLRQADEHSDTSLGAKLWAEEALPQCERLRGSRLDGYAINEASTYEAVVTGNLSPEGQFAALRAIMGAEEGFNPPFAQNKAWCQMCNEPVPATHFPCCGAGVIHSLAPSGSVGVDTVKNNPPRSIAGRMEVWRALTTAKIDWSDQVDAPCLCSGYCILGECSCYAETKQDAFSCPVLDTSINDLIEAGLSKHSVSSPHCPRCLAPTTDEVHECRYALSGYDQILAQIKRESKDVVL